MKKNYNKEQEKIGEFIKTLRVKKGLTQEGFAKILKTSQSVVARIEAGKQNVSTGELLKISDALNHNIVSIKDSVDFKIVGGRKLSGSVDVNSSKNGAMGLIAASLLNLGTTRLYGIPNIEEVNRLFEILISIGVSVDRKGDYVEIKRPKVLQIKKLDMEAAQKTRTMLMFIGSLLHDYDEFKMPHAGGCKMGHRTIAAHKYALEELGVKIKVTKDDYIISKNKLSPKEITMYEASDTATINALIAAAKIPGKTTITFAPSNYQVQDVCFFLQNLGVKVEGVGTSTLIVEGVKEIDTNVEHYNSEDPTEAMFFVTAAIMTDSKLTVKRVPIDFMKLELLKLQKMGLKFRKSKEYKSKNGKTKLVDVTILPSKLKALPDKIHPLPYPGLNVDNLPFFVPICTKAIGTTLIHDWMWENRAIYFTELNRLGAQITLADPHRLFVEGETPLKAAQVVCPPALRPATIILLAMLGAEGTSILRNVYSIKRGYEEIAERLTRIGADVSVLKGV